ncbi:D-amino-acid transaminase, chloroplastic-like isoform X3 [Raphanus sativus]|uniref:D-amino-acid transaminase, chloroplastic-like isoform X3 n=1 Tax=Raphanus sativus TaxID=3726 RepID=A0A9W3DAW2_RAPSA|nr:D-amino-acid transaminase, chloroplastic-like isoform X3 [Raphanus sativus]
MSPNLLEKEAHAPKLAQSIYNALTTAASRYENHSNQFSSLFQMSSRFVSFPESITGFLSELSVNNCTLRFLSGAQCSSGRGLRFPRTRRGRTLMCSGSNSHSWNVPVLSSNEVVERLKLVGEGKQLLAMYSSVVGGITTDPAAMVLPLDDHMVHRGHGVFDTAMIINGHLYELDQHLDRILRSASMAKIPLPFDRETIRKILIQTVSVSGCRYGSLRYWLSAGPGDFSLSPSHCPKPSLYAIVYQKDFNVDRIGVKMEAEAKGAFAGIWVDNDGFIAEGPNMNVAFVVNGGRELVMPRFDNVLSGCTARRTITLAEQLVRKGMLKSVRVMDMTVEDGKNADEMMLLGSGVLVKPVIQWDEEVIADGKEGHITNALLDLLLEDMSSGPPSVEVISNCVLTHGSICFQSTL